MNPPVPARPAEVSKPDVVKRARGVIVRADGRVLCRLFLYFEEPVAKKLKRHCFDVGRDLSDFVNEQVKTVLSGTPPENDAAEVDA